MGSIGGRLANQARRSLAAREAPCDGVVMAESLEGTVDRVRYVSPETSWTVATLREDGAPWPATIVGVMPGLVEGMRVKVDGNWVDDARWGRQLQVQRHAEVIPTTRDGIEAYLAERGSL